MPLTTLSGAVFLVVPRALPQPRLLHDLQASRYQRLQSRVPSLSHSRFDSANWILMSSNSYTRSGQPLFYLSESEESSETQSSDSSETETDDDGSDAMDTDNDPSLYEFNPTDSDREQFHKPDPFPPREKFPYPEAHTQREQPFNSPRASSPRTASSSGSSSGPQPSPSRPQPNLTYLPSFVQPVYFSACKRGFDFKKSESGQRRGGVKFTRGKRVDMLMSHTHQGASGARLSQVWFGASFRREQDSKTQDSSARDLKAAKSRSRQLQALKTRDCKL
ncbi:hypothetical protein R3P38DRAFT_2796644 [Favolaschia claudopus]|uniref:Uncharacterized protein n=1 Tax=Favolaschia claudopus TaxID=2862362 RepID=A0AAW0A4T8_9AGAR